jgi:D-alanyl-lipoteichoic acid acyltransferase DltB (MBOAT superfamily)
MSFSSLHFLIFLPVAAAIYYLLPVGVRWIHLLAASCVFYMAYLPGYILLVFAMILVDFLVAIAMAAPEAGHGRRTLYLSISLSMNLGLLAFFKYYNFFAANLDSVLGHVGLAPSIPLLGLIVPLGLSFHVFQAMSYSLEVYRGEQTPERNFGRYALYMMFFPSKAMGPIERPQQLLPQCHLPHPFDYSKVVDGLKQMAWGFFKKVVVADRLALGVDTVYGDPTKFAGVQLILATVFYSFQIYADFSGYADIAVGTGKIFGFDLVNNFRRPYFAASLADFWRRWHISLYSWFNDYLFTPLAVGQRDWGRLGVVMAIMVTFALSGLWHGAAWTFVAWGCLHGLGLSLGVLAHKRRPKISGAAHGPSRIFGILLTFGFVTFAFIFFRAKNLHDAVYIATHLGAGLPEFARHAAEPAALSDAIAAIGYYKEQFFIAVLAVFVMLGVEWTHARFDLRHVLQAAPMVLRWGIYYAIIIVIALYGAYNTSQPFIYVQF